MGKGKSVLEAKGAKRAALEQAAGPIGSAGKGPEDSVLSPELATEIAVLEVATGQIGSVGKNSEVSVASPALAPGALAPGVRGVAGVGVQQGQHVFASESAERERVRGGRRGRFGSEPGLPCFPPRERVRAWRWRSRLGARELLASVDAA